jgi:hypothetical protein
VPPQRRDPRRLARTNNTANATVVTASTPDTTVIPTAARACRSRASQAEANALTLRPGPTHISSSIECGNPFACAAASISRYSRPLNGVRTICKLVPSTAATDTPNSPADTPSPTRRQSACPPDGSGGFGTGAFGTGGFGPDTGTGAFGPGGYRPRQASASGGFASGSGCAARCSASRSRSASADEHARADHSTIAVASRSP